MSAGPETSLPLPMAGPSTPVKAQTRIAAADGMAGQAKRGSLPRDSARSAGARRSMRQQVKPTLIAGAAGFVCGAVCWHFVGFWAFVRDVVYHAPPSVNAPVRSASRPPPLPPKTAASRQVECTLAMRDRFAGEVRIAPCRGIAPTARPSLGVERADLLPQDGVSARSAVLGWSTRIELPNSQPNTTTERPLDDR